MQLPRPRTTLGRAVLPVIGGIGVFALLGLITWVTAVLLSRDPERVSDRLASPTFEVGPIGFVAERIADGGPIILPDLVRAGGLRTVVLDHTGGDPKLGWRVYYAYPADRDPGCKVTQVRRTRQFTDCEHRTIDVEQLAPPPGVFPLIDDDVTIDLRRAGEASGTATTTS